MDVIDVVMPLQEGRYISHEVLEGLIRQGISFRLWVSTKVSDGNYAAARNNIKQYGKSSYILMLDNDIVLPPGAIIKMQQFLDNHPEFAAIAIRKNEPPVPEKEEGVSTSPHVSMSCVLFRKEILEKITFSIPSWEGRTLPEGGCECAQCCHDIRAMGLEIGFLTGIQAIHLYDTRTV